MADSELILGLAGIAGTALAALGGNYTTLAVDRRRRRREEEDARQRLREAVRLVRGDLEGAATKFEGAVDRGQLWPESEPITDGNLDAYREQLARELSNGKAWMAVQSAEHAINKVVTVIVESSAGLMGARPAVEGPFVDLLRMAAEACAKASDELLQSEASLARR